MLYSMRESGQQAIERKIAALLRRLNRPEGNILNTRDTQEIKKSGEQG